MMYGMAKDNITVCICTYHRDAMLEHLLRTLASQDTGGLFTVSIVVVDNDSAAPSKALVMRLGEELGIRVVYEVEPIRTIPAARNHALRLAEGNFIAMIDDDEFAPATWLLTMYRALHTFNVHGVLGPVFPFFQQPPPAWLLRGQFSGAPAIATGTLMRWQQTYAGNSLLKTEVCSKLGVRFDESYTIGGEDRAFFQKAMDAGCRFVAVEEGAVYETVPPERWTKKYYFRRAIANGLNAHRADVANGWSVSKVVTYLKSAVAVCVYALLLPFTVLFGDHLLVSVLERGGHHLSRLCATVHVPLLKDRGF
jgi:succinoglycan biosynthesis protein ExoM